MKNTIKLIRTLDLKKARELHQLFIVEGDKSVSEALSSSLTVEYVLAKKEWLEQVPGELLAKVSQIIEINDRQLSQISFLKTPNQAISLVRIPQYTLEMTEIIGGLSLYLDKVQDPGNLGAIIRLADWFGIANVLCGEGCADPFSPKSVQSTMGAVLRVKTHKTDKSFFEKLKNHQPNFPVYGTFLDGNDLYSTPLSSNAVIVMGNESKGICQDVAQHVTQRVLIPQYPTGRQTSDSLNVALASAIVCAQFRRNKTNNS